MPIYEYACESCGTTFEKRMKMSDMEAESSCPECGEGAPRRFSVPAPPQVSPGGSSGPSCAPGGGSCCCSPVEA